MKSLSIICMATLALVFAADPAHAQARLEVRASAEAVPSRIAPEIRRMTRTDATAPKLRMEATVIASSRAPLPATLEWYVFGRTSVQGEGAGRAVTEVALMQASKESINAAPSPGTKTTYFAYAPGQERNGLRSEGWLVLLKTREGKLLDARASAAGYLPLARDEARLAAFTAKLETAGAEGNLELPLEVREKIKAEAEKNWPENPGMQAMEIKMKTDAHKAAYQK